MKTTSINISTLCVPCANRCRYCLLSWDGKLLGTDYKRAEAYAERFYIWLNNNRPEISFQFYYGYSMDHPHLADAIDFARRIDSAGGEFLQLDGLGFRTSEQIDNYLRTIMIHGIRVIDLTFYGTQDYHDRFAGRNGDFDYMLNILKHANELGLDVNISVPITMENADQMDPLIDLLDNYTINNLRIFVPHREGRGISLEKIRLREDKLTSLSPRVRSHINTARYKSEAYWIKDGIFPVFEFRMLGISLTPDNIDEFENMSFEEAIKYVEALDDNYYSSIPSFQELAELYGDKQGDALFSLRDLYLLYQHKYIAENNLRIYDINDERQCFSRRF